MTGLATVLVGSDPSLIAAVDRMPWVADESDGTICVVIPVAALVTATLVVDSSDDWSPVAIIERSDGISVISVDGHLTVLEANTFDVVADVDLNSNTVSPLIIVSAESVDDEV